jgi:hypothetical protein
MIRDLLRAMRDELRDAERRFIAWSADLDRRSKAGEFGKWTWQKDYGLWPWQRRRK